MIEVASISHKFNERWVLEGVSYKFPNSQVTSVLGKSGSGKTTFLQILNGMIRPTRGLVSAFGQGIDYQDLPALRMKIGYVIQQAGLFPHMTIVENITVLGKALKQSADTKTQRAEQLMDLVQIPWGYAQKFPHELSGGEQQRVGLCRAMYLNPSVLLMDEPFASLDYETKQGIYGHIHRLQTLEPRTIILVTHDWEEALTLSDNFLWLENGRIKKLGNKEYLKEVKAEYLDSQ